MTRCELLQEPILGLRGTVLYISRGTKHSAMRKTVKDGRMERNVVIRLLTLNGGFPYTTGCFVYTRNRSGSNGGFQYTTGCFVYTRITFRNKVI